MLRQQREPSGGNDRHLPSRMPANGATGGTRRTSWISAKRGKEAAQGGLEKLCLHPLGGILGLLSVGKAPNRVPLLPPGEPGAF